MPVWWLGDISHPKVNAPAYSSKVFLGLTANARFVLRLHVSFNVSRVARPSPVSTSNFCAKMVLAVINQNVTLMQQRFQR
jgi:hypothetical protein